MLRRVMYRLLNFHQITESATWNRSKTLTGEIFGGGIRVDRHPLCNRAPQRFFDPSTGRRYCRAIAGRSCRCRSGKQTSAGKSGLRGAESRWFAKENSFILTSLESALEHASQLLSEFKRTTFLTNFIILSYIFTISYITQNIRNNNKMMQDIKYYK